MEQPAVSNCVSCGAELEKQEMSEEGKAFMAKLEEKTAGWAERII